MVKTYMGLSACLTAIPRALDKHFHSIFPALGANTVVPILQTRKLRKMENGKEPMYSPRLVSGDGR
jgi:hypothetical protein